MTHGVLDFLGNKDNYYLGNEDYKSIKEVKEFQQSDFILYKLEDIVFLKNVSRRKAIENILSSVRISGINFIYLIMSNSEGINFYFGISKDLYSDEDAAFEVEEIGSVILKPNIKGNLQKVKIIDVTSEEKDNICKTINDMNLFNVLVGAAGVNDGDKKIRCIDVLKNVMGYEEFGLMVLAKSLRDECIFSIENNLNKLYEEISPLANITTTESISTTNGNDFAKSTGEAITNSYITSLSIFNIFSESTGGSSGTGTATINGSSETAQKAGNDASRTSGNSETTQNNTGKTIITKGRSEGIQNTRNLALQSTTISESKQENSKIKENWSETNEVTDIKFAQYARSNVTDSSVTDLNSSREEKSTSTTIENINKEVKNWIEYMDEVLYKRLDYGKGRGLFITSTFLFANNNLVLAKLENCIMPLFTGENGNKVPIQSISVNNDSLMTNSYKQFQLPKGNFFKDGYIDNPLARSALSQYIDGKGNGIVGNWISTKELSLITGIPIYK